MGNRNVLGGRCTQQNVVCTVTESLQSSLKLGGDVRQGYIVQNKYGARPEGMFNAMHLAIEVIRFAHGNG